MINDIHSLAGCGIKFKKCSQCGKEGCEDEGRCLWKKEKCFAKEKSTPPNIRPPLPTGYYFSTRLRSEVFSLVSLWI